MKVNDSSKEKLDILEGVIEDMDLYDIIELKDIIETHIEVKCEDQDLCKNCYTEMAPGDYVSEVYEFWGHKKSEKIPTKIICPDCGQRRDL